MKKIEVKKGVGASKEQYHILIDGGVNASYSNMVDLDSILQLAISKAHDIKKNDNIDVEVFDCVSDEKATCEECGSDDVEIRAWIHQLTGNIGGETGESNDAYCNACEAHPRFEYVEVKSPILIYTTK